MGFFRIFCSSINQVDASLLKLPGVSINTQVAKKAASGVPILGTDTNIHTDKQGVTVRFDFVFILSSISFSFR